MLRHKLKLQGNALPMLEMEAQIDTWHTWCFSELYTALWFMPYYTNKQ